MQIWNKFQVVECFAMLFMSAAFVIVGTLPSLSWAKEMARPDSVGGDYIVELVAGVVFEESSNVAELGVDLESFIGGTNHHFSFGLAAEIEKEVRGEDSFTYLGPLFSGYYHHFKVFFTTGILTDFKDHDKSKSRLGVGYEVVWLKRWLIVPTLAVDFLEEDTYLATSVGFAREF